MAQAPPASLLRRLTVLDLTLLTIGLMIGSGIFRNPSVVAHRAQTPALIVGCWVFGGLIALIGAFIFAELASRRPHAGGAYGYLTDAYGPVVGFSNVWLALAISATGATAAAAVLFSGYFLRLAHVGLSPAFVAVTAIFIVTIVNVLGVRQGSTLQNVLVALKLFGVAAIIVSGFIAHASVQVEAPVVALSGWSWLAAAGFAMLPVFFSYQGFQSAAYMTAETRDPGKTIPLALLFGVCGVIAVYLLVNISCLMTLGPAALAATKTPASDVMTIAVGPVGGTIVSVAIAIATLGYLSTSILLSPRMYFLIAADKLFFKQLAHVSPKTRTPVVAIALHGSIAAIIAVSGTYDQIITWVTMPVWFFIMLCSIAVFIFRKRDANLSRPAFTIPLHPWSTLFVIASIAGVIVAVLTTAPRDSLYGGIVLLAGVIFFYAWKRAHA